MFITVVQDNVDCDQLYNFTAGDCLILRRITYDRNVFRPNIIRFTGQTLYWVYIYIYVKLCSIGELFRDLFRGTR